MKLLTIIRVVRVLFWCVDVVSLVSWCVVLWWLGLDVLATGLFQNSLMDGDMACAGICGCWMLGLRAVRLLCWGYLRATGEDFPGPAAGVATASAAVALPRSVGPVAVVRVLWSSGCCG